jgi:hypothetical protein
MAEGIGEAVTILFKTLKQKKQLGFTRIFTEKKVTMQMLDIGMPAQAKSSRSLI